MIQEIVFHDNGKLFGAWGINNFPDGQQQFWIEQPENQLDLDICIKSPQILDLFIQIINTIRLRSVRITYLYGARSDKGTAGNRSVAHLPMILANLIRSSYGSNFLNTMYETVMPHCAYWPGRTIVELPDMRFKTLTGTCPKYDLIVFPDESAERRFGNYVEAKRTVTCVKLREQISGKIITHELPDLDFDTVDSILVVDDLCDGGATFMGLAQEIRDRIDYRVLDLSVTHGVFSNGAIDKLTWFYDTIFTTNSYQEFPGQPLVVENVWRCANR